MTQIAIVACSPERTKRISLKSFRTAIEDDSYDTQEAQEVQEAFEKAYNEALYDIYDKKGIFKVASEQNIQSSQRRPQKPRPIEEAFNAEEAIKQEAFNKAYKAVKVKEVFNKAFQDYELKKKSAKPITPMKHSIKPTKHSIKPKTTKLPKQPKKKPKRPKKQPIKQPIKLKKKLTKPKK